jgi:hypothetical protein
MVDPPLIGVYPRVVSEFLDKFQTMPSNLTPTTL